MGSSGREDEQPALGAKGFPMGQEKQNEEPSGT